jgi:hypothetical protein
LFASLTCCTLWPSQISSLTLSCAPIKDSCSLTVLSKTRLN